jgi:carboxypeptidase Q
MKFKPLFALMLLACSAQAQEKRGTVSDSAAFRRIASEVLVNGTCYDNLRVLCKQIGHRLSGSKQAEQAVSWGEKTLREAGADRVWLMPVDVPNWVRGKESLALQFAGRKEYQSIPVLSIGNTVGTDGKTLEREIIMIEDLDELKALSKDKVKGRIIFFNHAFPPEIINTFEGYGVAGPYRWIAPNFGSAWGADGVIIRSVSTGKDDFPHTGSMRYADTVRQIPAVAIGNYSADLLAAECKKGTVKAKLISNCKMMGTKPSYNVIGEIIGTDFPDQIVVAGGHLDSWDVGEGAHDDGAGIVQSIEIIRTMKALGIRPKRTLRVVLFMNEENGVKGGYAYADSAKAKGERHIFALESDAGGFSPRGIGLDMKPEKKAYVRSYASLFRPYGVYDFDQEEGGVDISLLSRQGVPTAGLLPDPQRYFDFHHTANDVFENVNHRELKLGAAVMTQLIYLVTEYGF